MAAASAAGWTRGLVFSVLGSLIGAGSKLCIRRSYTLLQAEADVDAVLMASTDDESYEALEPRPPALGAIQNDHHQPCRSWMLRFRAFLLRGIGILSMTTLSPVCNVYAMQFASPSILSPLGGGLTLVWVVLLSECTIGERPRAAQVVATGLILVGEIQIAVAGDHTNVYALSMDEVEKQYRNPYLLIYFSCVLLWLATLVCIIYFGGCSWRRFAWGMIGGSVTGNQNFIKDALAVLHGVGDNPYPLELFVMVLFAAIVPLVGLLLLMECMKRYDANYSASMFTGSMVATASIMSAIHYHTLDNISADMQWLYLLGLMVLAFGIITLATEARFQEDVKLRLEITRRSYDSV